MTADLIASRAIAQLGTPFRFRGRKPRVALDCVGLTLVAVGPLAPRIAEIQSYRMRGDYQSVISTCFEHLPFRSIDNGEAECDGDIVLAMAGPSQLHLMIAANGGWVHAHAALGRVVFTPEWPNWPIVQRWRLIGK